MDAFCLRKANFFLATFSFQDVKFQKGLFWLRYSRITVLFHLGSRYNFIPDSRGRIAYPTSYAYRFQTLIPPNRLQSRNKSLFGNILASCIWPQGNNYGQRGDQRCQRCGLYHGTWCPAVGKTCRNCGNLNHFQSVCKSRANRKQIHNVNVNSDVEDESAKVHEQDTRYVNTFFIGSLDDANDDVPPWRIDLRINDLDVNFKIDTGADVSVITESQWKKMRPRPKIHTTQAKLESPGGKVETLGQFVAKTSWRGKQTNLRMFVLKNKTDCLLSRSAALTLGLVKRLDEMKDAAFGDVGKPVDCQPVKIELKEDAEPYSISVPRRVPIPLLPKVEKELDRMLSQGIIARVTEPTDWCAPIVPVMKKNGDVRICVDLKKLNKSVKRERYTLPTLDDVTHKLSGSKVYSKLDATSGFWQIPLDEETAKLTTFLTPFGRFFFKRLPFGISLAPEIFQRAMENMLQGIDGVVCFMDDVVVSGDSDEQHDKRLTEVLDRMTKAGLTLNKEKCEFKKEKLDILGHTFSKEGIQPDKSKVKAILEMDEPQNETELRRFLGMVNYLGKFLPNLSDITHPLNALLNKDVTWMWGPDQKTAVEKLKAGITSAPTLVYFDMNKPTVVCSDASSYGLGGVLYQQHGSELKPVAFCSRTLTQAETRYAQIEKELLAIVYACSKFERYLTGLPEIKFITDHRPLVPLLNKKDLIDTPITCQRMIMRLMRFNVTAEYMPGKLLVVADTLSRSPLSEKSSLDEVELETDVTCHVDAMRVSWPISDEKLNSVRKATEEDVVLSTALQYTREGWPEYKEDVMLAARELYSVKDELSERDGVLIRGDRIVIPYSCRQDILGKIHDGHQGIEKCRERARSCVWWPGMSTDIKAMVQRCRHCIEKAPTQKKEPLIPSVLPQYPFQKVGVDLCENRGEKYMILVDYYSRYIEIAQLGMGTSSQAVIKKLKEVFARHGIPEILVSDNGSQFSCRDFKMFMCEWGVCHKTSSPRHPQSNGEAERAVQTAKQIVSQKDSELALLSYRATKIPSLGASPAELAFGRNLRTRLPSLQKNLVPFHTSSAVREKDRVAKNNQKFYYDQRHGSTSLPLLQSGDSVRIKCDGNKGWQQPGTVVGQCGERSYLVDTPKGQFRRNRRFLRKVPPEVNQNMERMEDIPLPSGDIQITPDPVEPAQEPTVPDNPPSPPVRTTRCGREVRIPQRYQ